MVLDYIKSITFILLFITFIYIVGCGFVENKKSFSFKFIIGYVIYNAILTVIGIFIQFFNINWYIFLMLEILLIITLVVYSFYKNRNLFEIVKKDFHDFFKNQWFLIVVCIVLIGMSIFDIPIHWINNHLDDGYYLNRISTMPYIDNPYLTDPATGLLSAPSLIRSINVFELEASGYVYLLQISPVLFTRISLSFINYFLFIQCAYLFALKINISMKTKVAKMYLQFFLSPVIFFGIYYEWMNLSKILILQDGWQFNTAMWYGSSVVRVSGIFLCFLPFFEKRKIQLKDLGYFILLCFCLFGKASQALPVLFITGVSYLLYTLISTKGKKNIIISFGVIILIMASSIVKSPDYTLYSHIISLMIQNQTSLVLWASLIIFVASFSLKSTVIKKWNILLIMFFAFMFVPIINNLFLILSVYDFVAARTLTLFHYTFITTNFIYLFLLLSKYLNIKKVIIICITSFITINTIFIACFHSTRGIRTTGGIIRTNPEIFPEKIIELSKKINEIAIDRGIELDVISSEYIVVNRDMFSLSVMLRLYAPNINSISALFRYPSRENDEYKYYSLEDQEIYYNFQENPENYITELNGMLSKYSIECIITTKDCTSSLESIGYNLEFSQPVDTYDSYNLYVYIKN